MDIIKKIPFLFLELSLKMLKKHNLCNNKYVGKTFNIVFNSKIEIEEDGDEQEYIIRTIIGLELLEQ